jgi:hypothetical protein
MRRTPVTAGRRRERKHGAKFHEEPGSAESGRQRSLSVSCGAGSGLLVMLAIPIRSRRHSNRRPKAGAMGLSPSAAAPASHCDLRMVQRLTARLGVFTGRRHGGLIRQHFWRACAKVSDAGLTAAAIGSLVTEFIGVADIGEFNGISRGIALPLAAVTLPPVVCAGSCRRSSCRTDRRRQVLNAFRLPVVNGLLSALAARALPVDNWLRGWRPGL